MKKVLCFILSVLIILLSVTPVIALGNPTLSLVAEKTSFSRGSELSLTVRLQNCDECRSLGLVFDYDTDNTFEVLGGDWLLEGTTLENFSTEKVSAGIAVAGFSKDVDPNGDIFVLNLKVKENAPSGETTVKVTPTIKNGSVLIPCSETTIKLNIEGDESSEAILTVNADKSTVSENTEIELTVNLKNCNKCKSVGLAFDYDTENTFEVLSGDWLLVGTTLDNFSTKKVAAGAAAAGFSKETDANGNVFVLRLRVKENAPIGEKIISVNPVIKNDSIVIPCKIATTKVKIVPKDCKHENKTLISEQNSTCKEQGNDKYYVCDDCGQIIAADGSTELEAAPFRPLGDHKGGTATCKAKAVCSVCGLSYGDYGSHSYTDQIKKAETLKSAGTCKNEAVYYYSCSVCGACEHNDSHTFLDEKDSHAHTGETEVKNAKEATCCEDGYTGDTYCKGCNTKIESGSAIPATGNRTDADGKWETDGTKHWHTCYHGTTFDEAVHSGGTATCKAKAVCKDCGVEYGDYAAHQLTKHDRVEPTFETNGNIEYWTCNECGKYFSDAEGKNEINADDIVIGKLTIKKLTYLDGEVLIEVPSNAVGEFEITVDKIVPPPAEIVEKVKDTYGESSEVLAYYEIRMFDENGARIYNLNNEITVKSKLPEKYKAGYVVKINQEDDNGNLVEMQSWREGEFICYKTNWLEKYL